jgi:CBS domain containing-hemolysin-like protein
MYWQAYLHKTSVVAELILTKILKRAKELTESGIELPCSASLHFFMVNKISLVDFYRVFNVDEHLFEEAKGDSSTLAGLIIEILGRVPQKGEHLDFHHYTFTIETANHRRLDRVKVQKQQP